MDANLVLSEMCKDFGLALILEEAKCSSVVECSLMVRRVFGSILHGGPIELYLVLASAGVRKAVVCAIMSVGWCM